MKHVCLLAFVTLLLGVAASAAGALESSAETLRTGDRAAATATQGKSQNFFNNLQSTINNYRSTVTNILSCHRQNKFWAGATTCINPDTTHISMAADVVEKPAIVVNGTTPDCQTQCYEQGNWWSGSSITCYSTCACICTTGEATSTVSVQGSTVYIQPRQCTARSVGTISYSNAANNMLPGGILSRVCRSGPPSCPSGWVTPAQFQQIELDFYTKHPSQSGGATGVIANGGAYYNFQLCYQYTPAGTENICGNETVIYGDQPVEQYVCKYTPPAIINSQYF